MVGLAEQSRAQAPAAPTNSTGPGVRERSSAPRRDDLVHRPRCSFVHRGSRRERGPRIKPKALAWIGIRTEAFEATVGAFRDALGLLEGGRTGSFARLDLPDGNIYEL